MSTAEPLEGAEPFHAAGGPAGVLVLHGFTGSPQSMRGLAEAFAGAGATVELPLLPGHGTSITDLQTTGWDDWYAAAEAAYTELAGRASPVVVAGLSMGGTLALTLAADHPEIGGLVLVNPLAELTDPGLAELLDALSEQGETQIPGIGSDIADPAGFEQAYDATPVEPLRSLLRQAAALPDRLPSITCPVLLLSSVEDHVVDPRSGETLVATVGGPIEQVKLARSYHVATLDYDKDEIERRAVAFVAGLAG